MSQLVSLRQKIRSIQTTKKITHAVRLVSMSLYNKLDKMGAPLKTYADGVKSLLLQLSQADTAWHHPILSPKDTADTNPLYIIIATSKGLCGSLNSNLFRYTDTILAGYKETAPSFIAIGQKAITFIKNKNNAVLTCSYTELSSHNFIAIADDLIEKISIAPRQYSSVTFLSSEAASFFVQKPLKLAMAPVALDAPHLQGGDVVDAHLKPALQKSDLAALIWEQDSRLVLDYLASCYLRSTATHALFQALRAEHAARFLAMENSTNNAEKILERLTLQFNKLRQALITKEVSELAAGFPVR